MEREGDREREREIRIRKLKGKYRENTLTDRLKCFPNSFLSKYPQTGKRECSFN